LNSKPADLFSRRNYCSSTW